jgi:sulfotransferase
MKKYHFISGLPRSGSTLLSTILNQNPKFNANISSPLARFVRSIITESHAGPGYHLQCDETRRLNLIQGLIDSYYQDETQEVFFNTNRGWTALIDVLTNTHPDSKIICCVRDFPQILNSFENLFRKNPFNISKLYSTEAATTVFTRCDALMSHGHTVRFAADCLYEALTGYNANKILLVEYEDLAKKPDVIMKIIYKFINEPYFEHDFDNVAASYDEYDLDANIKNLHTIRKKVEYLPISNLLPTPILEKYSNLEFWR